MLNLCLRITVIKAEAMKNNGVTIQGTHIGPGQKSTVMLTLPELYDCSPMYIPVHVISGKLKGPTLVVFAVLHGDEINGFEIVHRLLKKQVLSRLHGNLITVPISNMYGFIYKSRYLMDRRDLNRSFPGSKKGSIAARLADLLLTDIASAATHIIDLHTGSLYRSNVPQIRATLKFKENLQMAKAFSAPVILDTAVLPGSLRESVNKLKIPYILYEAGEALRFDDFSINLGVKGIMNVMHTIKMLDDPASNKINARTKHPKKPTIAYSSKWLRANCSGMMQPKKNLGQHVDKNEVVAIITDPLTMRETKMLSSIPGIVIGMSNLPLIHEGEAIFHVASVDKPQTTADNIAELEEFYDH